MSKLKSEQLEEIINIKNSLGVGQYDFTPMAKVHVVGSVPNIYLAAIGTNQSNSGEIRFLEHDNINVKSYLGAFIRYDGGSNLFYFGVHDNEDVLEVSDRKSIVIDRVTGNVGINVTPTKPFEVSVGVSGNNVAFERRTTWGGVAYPTLRGTSVDELLVYHNPIIPYLVNGYGGFTGATVGARLRFGGVNDDNTKYWDVGVPSSLSGDKFSVGRAGTSILTLDNVGKVGINNTSPSYRLHVGSNASTVDEIMQIESMADAGIILRADTDDADETHNAYIKFYQDADVVSGGIGIIGNGGVNPLNVAYTGALTNNVLIEASSGLQIGTNSSVRMTFLNDGKVGIGTNAPSYKFHVQDNVEGIKAVFGSGTGLNTIVIGNTGADTYRLSLGYNIGLEYGYIQAYASSNTTYDDIALNPDGGRVGIGYIDPTEKLTVAGDISIQKKVKLSWNDTTKSLDYIFA